MSWTASPEWEHKIWSGLGMSLHLCLALGWRLFMREAGRHCWNSQGLVSPDVLWEGNMAKAGSEKKGEEWLEGVYSDWTGSQVLWVPFYSYFTNESGVLGPLWNIRGHSTPLSPHLHLHRNVIKLLKASFIIHFHPLPHSAVPSTDLLVFICCDVFKWLL